MKRLFIVLSLALIGCREIPSPTLTPLAPLVPVCTLTQNLGSIGITCGNQTVSINQVTIQPFCPGRGGAYYSNSSYGALGFLENYIQIGSTDYAILDTGNVNGTYLTNLAVGNYVTSDNTGCNFTINSDGSITVLN